MRRAKEEGFQDIEPIEITTDELKVNEYIERLKEDIIVMSGLPEFK